MYPLKYFTLNIFINDIFSVKKFPNYGTYLTSLMILFLPRNHYSTITVVTTSPVIESPQGYWNITGNKPHLPGNVTSKIFSGKYY